MAYTLGQAARASGKSKPTIARAIHAERLSASRSEDGSYVIDPAELQRVYPSAGNGDGTMKQSVPGERTGTSLAELLVERDRLVAEQAETIRDLRARREAEERRQLIAILTDQRRRPW